MEYSIHQSAPGLSTHSEVKDLPGQSTFASINVPNEDNVQMVPVSKSPIEQHQLGPMQGFHAKVPFQILSGDTCAAVNVHGGVKSSTAHMPSNHFHPPAILCHQGLVSLQDRSLINCWLVYYNLRLGSLRHRCYGWSWCCWCCYWCWC